MNKLLSDDEIIERVLKGQINRFADLIQRYQERVFRLSYRMLHRREDAEDASQEVFLLIYRSLPRYCAEGKFWPWMRRITVNCCMKRLSNECAVADIEEIIDSRLDTHDPVEKEVLTRLALAEVREAIAELKGPYRTVMVLRYEEDLSYKEIAELLCESVNTVQVRLHRARKALAERLAMEARSEV